MAAHAGERKRKEKYDGGCGSDRNLDLGHTISIKSKTVIGTKDFHTMSAPEATSTGDAAPRLRPRPAPDLSVLRPSIHVSITGMRQAVKALENGTEEIRHLLFNECNVLYECKTCFNMFRSVANLIAHKRSYCRTRHQDIRHVYHSEEDPPPLPTTAYVEPEPIETIIPEKEWDLREYSPSLELLKDAGILDEIENRPTVPTLMPKKKGIHSIVNKLKEKQAQSHEMGYYKSRENDVYHKLRLEPMKETSQAVFQTMVWNGPSMGEKYRDLQKLKQRPTVLMGPDGKVIEPGAPTKSLYSSPDSTKENQETKPLRYPCPYCKKDYNKLVSVYKHIVQNHNKTMEQAKGLKKKIKKMASSNQARLTSSKATVQQGSLFCYKCFRDFKNPQGKAVHEAYCKVQGLDSKMLLKSSLFKKTPVVFLERISIPKGANPLSSDAKVSKPTNTPKIEKGVSRAIARRDSDDEITFNPLSVDVHKLSEGEIGQVVEMIKQNKYVNGTGTNERGDDEWTVCERDCHLPRTPKVKLEQPVIREQNGQETKRRMSTNEEVAQQPKKKRLLRHGIRSNAKATDVRMNRK